MFEATRRRALAVSSVAAIALSAGMAWGHDEDHRKLLDREPPVDTPPWAGQFGARGGSSGGFPADNMTLYAWMPLSSFPGTQVSGNDCWGYVSASGREYAIMGLQSGYAYVDVSDPAFPEIVAYIEGPGSLWHDVKTIGDYAYGVSEGGWGIQVMDLSDIDNGNVTLVQNKTQNGHTDTHNIAANTDSGYLYLLGANIANGGIIAVDTNADPTNPTIVGAYTSEYVHDAQIVTYDSGTYAGREIAFCFNGGRGFDIIDVTNKSNMWRRGGLNYSGRRYTHQGWLSEDKRYVFLNDEMDEGNSVATTTTRVIDVSNLASPFLAATFTTGLAATDHNLFIKGDRLYESNYRSGLHVFDISNPLNPVKVGSFDTYPDTDTNGYHGAWSNYPYFDSGTIIISDIERGMFIVTEGIKQIEFIGGDDTEIVSPTGTTTTTIAAFGDGVTLDPATVQLHVSYDNGPVQTIAMDDIGNDEFTATFPAGDCYANVDYWYTAQDTDGRTFKTPWNAPTTPFVATIATDQQTPINDTFETNLGWISTGDATTGLWERGVPINAGDGGPEHDGDGSGQCYVTGNEANRSVNGGAAELISPAIDLSNAEQAFVSYWRYLSVAYGSGQIRVDASDDDGATWHQIEASTSNTPDWLQKRYRLNDFIDLTSTVRIRFTAQDVSPLAVTEAGVDGVRIDGQLCAPCPADFNADGVVDTGDFLDFLNAYTSLDDSADIDGNDMINSSDFIAFLNLFVVGCP